MLRATIIAAGLLITLAGTGAQQPNTEPKPCVPSIAQDAPSPEVLRRAVNAADKQRMARMVPADPLRLCATKALRGDFGKLAPWQTIGYKLALSGKYALKLAWLTTYYPQEGFWRGKGCRWGIGASERVAAANLLPAKTYVWISNPPHLRQVWDTGARWNDSVARRKGADLWVDLWVPRPGWKGLDTRVTDVFVLRPGGADQ